MSGLKEEISLAAKYIVGIDLGTTNSALAFCDASAADEEESRIEVRSIPQLVNPNEVAERTLLPSFLYVPANSIFPRAASPCHGKPSRSS
jgi:molecular chaperone DnaK (HSP70)